MDYHYEIVHKRKMAYLYRVEEDGTPIKLAIADDKKTMFQLIRMKNLFEEDPFPIEELHAAEALRHSSIKTNKPSWTSVGLVGGRMEVWEISEAQTRALKKIRDKEKVGFHRSTIDHRTIDRLIKHGLVKTKRACPAYLVISDEGNKLLGRIER